MNKVLADMRSVYFPNKAEAAYAHKEFVEDLLAQCVPEQKIDNFLLDASTLGGMRFCIDPRMPLDTVAFVDGEGNLVGIMKNAASPGTRGTATA